jgi:hypothetical protein
MGKKKGQCISQVCKADWVVLKPMRLILHMLLPMKPLVFKTVTIMDMVDVFVAKEDVVVKVVLPDMATVGF